MTTLNLPAKTTVYFGESRKPLLFVIMRPSFILMLDKYVRLTIRKGAYLRTVYQAQLWGRKQGRRKETHLRCWRGFCGRT